MTLHHYPEFNCERAVKKHLKHVSLGAFPTPIEEHTLPAGSFWLKRDDLSSPLYGGNKVRKLEFLLGRKTGPVVTFGGFGSHHVLATGIFARQCKRKSIGILVDQPPTRHSNAVRALLQKHVDHIVPLSKMPSNPLSMGLHLLGSIAPNPKVTIIPPGGSNIPGVIGYVLGALEIKAQISALKIPPPDEIWIPLGTGGTAAGLALGLGLGGLKTKVVAVRVASHLTGNEAYIRFLAQRTFHFLKKFHQQGEIPPLRIHVEHGYIGEGYGFETDEGRRAIDQAAKVGIALENTYSGKCMAAMIHAMKNRNPTPKRMFLDTYGPIGNLKDSTGRIKSE